MSSYHNVTDGTSYPAVLLETGANDPRVDPWQMAKMTARLQAATASGKPVLLRVDYAGGHGMMGATRDQENQQLGRIRTRNQNITCPFPRSCTCQDMLLRLALLRVCHPVEVEAAERLT
jgi:hypothetical protein